MARTTIPLLAAALTVGVAVLIGGNYLIAAGNQKTAPAGNGLMEEDSSMTRKIQKTDQEWRSQLTPEQYRVTRECGTEPPFSGKYYYHHEDGTYRCVACGNKLFDSKTKYESGSGWPSFWQPASNEAIEEKKDTTHGMTRTEIVCSKCGAHLGHVFPDGPRPTGLRYCVNSAALDFEEDTTEIEKDSEKPDSSEHK